MTTAVSAGLARGVTHQSFIFAINGQPVRLISLPPRKVLKLHDISKRVAGNCEPLAIFRAFGLAPAEFERLTSYYKSAYSQFTEGFDTADLRDAQKLLQKLGRNIHRKRTKIATKTIGTRRRRSPLVA